MTIIDVRKSFPYLGKGMIYFNHSSSGPLPKPALEIATKYLSDKSEGKIDDYKEFLQIMGETRKELALMINTTPDRIAFTDNTSNGINIIAQSIKWKKGDRIILNDVEFPANVYPFLNLEKDGIEIDFVKSKNGIVTSENILEAIKPQTRLISISQVQFLSGYRVDLEQIGKFCKERGIIFCVDAIQGLGALRLDVEKCNVDFISCGVQKWMLGMQGLAFIYVRKELQEQMEPKYVGWTSVEGAWDLLKYNLKLKRTADCFHTGTLNTLGIYALRGTMKLFSGFGFDRIEERVLENTSHFIEGLKYIGLWPILTDCDKKFLSGIVSFNHSNASKIIKALEEKNIIASAREGVVRFSPHFYNIKEEIDIVLEELGKIF